MAVKCGKFRRMAAIALMTAFAAVTSFGAFEIGEAMKEPPFWTSDPVLFVRRNQEAGFNFTSDERRGADSRLDGGVTCYGLPVYESKVAFGEEGGIVRVELLLYTTAGTEGYKVVNEANGRKVFHRIRVKAPELDRDAFAAILDKVREKLGKINGRIPEISAERLKGSDAVQKSQEWPAKGDVPRTVLVWNFRQDGGKTATFRSGFIRLAFDAPGTKVKSAKGAYQQKSAKSAKKITDNIVRDPRGDVFLDNVPMVDQGQKGYCAAASAERVLRYYGLDVDEHEIAQVAGTDADRGTYVEAMKESVAAIGKKYRLAAVVCYGDFDKGVGDRIDGLNEEVKEYNKVAKKLKKAPITEDMYIHRSGNRISFNPAAVDRAMDPEVRKEMIVSGKKKGKYVKFLADVKQQIDRGIPLLWGLNLGIYPEPGIPQKGGGHIRLIIGYNEKKKEILYSDSWGAGHELKRMPSDWAFTASHCLMYLKPLR